MALRHPVIESNGDEPVLRQLLTRRRGRGAQRRQPSRLDPATRNAGRPSRATKVSRTTGDRRRRRSAGHECLATRDSRLAARVPRPQMASRSSRIPHRICFELFSPLFPRLRPRSLLSLKSPLSRNAPCMGSARLCDSQSRRIQQRKHAKQGRGLEQLKPRFKFCRKGVQARICLTHETCLVHVRENACDGVASLESCGAASPHRASRVAGVDCSTAPSFTCSPAPDQSTMCSQQTGETLLHLKLVAEFCVYNAYQTSHEPAATGDAGSDMTVHKRRF